MHFLTQVLSSQLWISSGYPGDLVVFITLTEASFALKDGSHVILVLNRARTLCLCQI